MIKAKKESDIKKDMNHLMKKTKILAMATTGRAGSIYLQSLFDGHPQVLTIPYPVYVCQMYNFISPQLKGMNKKNHQEKINTAVKRLMEHSKLKLMLYPKYEDDVWWEYSKVIIDGKRTAFQIDRETFRIHLESILTWIFRKSKIEERSVYYAINLAWAYTTKKNMKDIKYVLDHSHQVPLFNDVNRICKGSYYMHSTRDPRANVFSIMKMFESLFQGYPMMMPPARMMGLFTHYENDFSMIDSFKKKWMKEDHYKIIKLEDMHTSFEDVINGLCSWLKIKNTKSLRKSTINGYTYSAMSFSKGKAVVGKQDTKKKQPWEKAFNDKEKRMIEYMYADEMDKLGYEREFWLKDKPSPLMSAKIFFRPNKYLSFHTYSTMRAGKFIFPDGDAPYGFKALLKKRKIIFPIVYSFFMAHQVKDFFRMEKELARVLRNIKKRRKAKMKK